MRKIPVIINNDFGHIVGWLELNDTVDEKLLSDMFVSWLGDPVQDKLMAVSLVPMQSV